MGGTWPASIWHTYAENMFVPLGIEPFPAPVFTGQTWNQVPPSLRIVGRSTRSTTTAGTAAGTAWQRERQREPHPLAHLLLRPAGRDLHDGHRRRR